MQASMSLQCHLTWLVAEPRDCPLVWAPSDASVVSEIKPHGKCSTGGKKKTTHGMRKSSDAVSNFHSNVLFIRG